MRHGFTTLTQNQKMQSKQWKQGVVMTSIFWDSQGVIMIDYDYLEQGLPINGVYYASKLRRLCQKITTKWQGKLTCGVKLLQDNAPAHTSQVVMTAATECGLEILPNPPYSPDMAPSDFYLFQKLKSHLYGTQNGSNEGVIEAVNENLGDQENAFYVEGIRTLTQRLAMCIALKGIYIEK